MRTLNFDWPDPPCPDCLHEYCLCPQLCLAEDNLNNIDSLEEHILNIKSLKDNNCYNNYDLTHKVLTDLIDRQKLFNETRSQYLIIGNKKIKKKTKGNYKKLVFLTLNPDSENQNLKSLDLWISKSLNSKSILTYYYYYEWRNHNPAENLFQGLHCHIILLGETKKIIQHINRQRYPFFKDIKKYPLSYLQDKINYSSNTFDEKKTIKKKNDKIAREYYNLLPMYTNKSCPKKEEEKSLA